MRKNATFISFLGIKPEENAVKAAKNGKKVAQKQGGYQFCRRKHQKQYNPIKKVAENRRCRLPTHDHTVKNTYDA